MRSRRICCLAFFALGLVARGAFALPPLAELEARLSLSPENQMYEQAYQAARAAAQAGNIGLGLAVYGSAGYADNHDVVDATHSRSYTQTGEGLGLMLPLLGSRLQLRGGVDEQLVQLARLDAGRELQRRDSLRRLRKAYADYWQAQRQQLLAEQYLADAASIEQALTLRTRAGLLLDSDRLELESGFELARRDAAVAAAAQANALDSLRALTHSELAGGIAAPPLFSECAAGGDGDDTWIDADPELRGLQRVAALRADDPRASALYPVQSSIQLGYQNKDELTTGRHGGSGAVTWTFQIPVGYGSERRLLSQAAAAELARARLEYEVRRSELQTQRRALLQRGAALRESVQFAASHLAASDAAVREREQRASQLAGDVVEQLQRARLTRYNAAKAVVDANVSLVAWYAEWSRFDGTPCASGAAGFSGAAAQGAVAREGARTLYVWQAADWLADAATPSGDVELARLRAAGVSRLLVSLNAEELSRTVHDSAALLTAVRRTQRRGVQVELLLGDPSWIDAAHRPELLRIVQQLEAVPFDALHLDLEPEQTLGDGADHGAVIASLAATLRAVAAASPWPLELSLHPRNLDAMVEGESFAELLQQLRIEPTLMVYVANPERAVAIALPPLRRYPQLRFRVALSLERAAPAEQSLATLPDDERRTRIAQVEQQLRRPNFDGIALQLEDGWSLARAQNGD